MDIDDDGDRSLSSRMDVDCPDDDDDDRSDHIIVNEDINVHSIAANTYTKLFHPATGNPQHSSSSNNDDDDNTIDSVHKPKITVILEEEGIQFSNDEFDELLSLTLQQHHHKSPMSLTDGHAATTTTPQSVEDVNDPSSDSCISWNKLVVHLPVHPGVHSTNKTWLDESCVDPNTVNDNGTNSNNVVVSLNLTPEQLMRFLNVVGNIQVRIEELYIIGNNRIDNLVVPLLLTRLHDSSLHTLKWCFSYGRQWPIDQLKKFATVLQRQTMLKHVELTNLDFVPVIMPSSLQLHLHLQEHQDSAILDQRLLDRRPLDIILHSLEGATHLETFIVQMKHGSNLRHLIRPSTWDDRRSDEPFHSAEMVGKFILHHSCLEHLELLNWNISDADCASMAESFRRHHVMTISKPSLNLKSIVLSHYHQSASCSTNQTTTDGLRYLLATCLAPTTRVENFCILPSLPWTRTRSVTDGHSSLPNGSRQLESLILDLLRDNCCIQRLCIAVPGMVLSQSTLCQIELYEKLNQAGRKFWRTEDNMSRSTWLKIMAQLSNGLGPDGKEYSMSTLRYTNDMIFLALKENSHHVTETHCPRRTIAQQIG